MRRFTVRFTIEGADHVDEGRLLDLFEKIINFSTAVEAISLALAESLNRRGRGSENLMIRAEVVKGRFSY